MPENNDVRLENVVAVMFSDYMTADDYEKLQLGQMYARIASGDVKKYDFDNDKAQDWNNLYKNVTSARGQDTKTEKGQAYDARCKIFDMFDFVTKNPDDTKSKNFMKFLENVMFTNRLIKGRIIAKQVQDFAQITSNEDVAMNAMLLLGKISAFQDEKLKYNCCKYLYKNMVSESSGAYDVAYKDVKERAVTICANSPLATVEDLFALQQMDAKNVEKTKQIFADMEPMARKELDAELKSESSDIQKIKHICGQVIICANFTNDDAIIAQVKDAYNVNKILMGNPVEYVSKMPNPYAEKMASLEKQLTELQQQSAEAQQRSQRQITELQQRLSAKTDELQNLTNMFNETKQTLRVAQAQNQELNTQNSQLRQANETLVRARETSDAKTRKLIDATKKVGLLGSGVNNLKKLVEEMEK